MNRRGLLTVALLLAACAPVAAAGTEVKAGGVAIVFPSPASDFSEVGDKLRTTVFELLVPSANRLLSAYLPQEKLDELNRGTSQGGFDSYAMVEVIRQAEYVDISPEFFAQITKDFDPSQVGKAAAGSVQDFESEMNSRLKALGTKTVDFGQPEILGALFQKPNATAIAMVMGLKQGDRSVNMSAGMAAIRVRQRFLFLYLFHQYNSPQTVIDLRKKLESWTDAILAANQ
jgi:hypothetical protein